MQSSQLFDAIRQGDAGAVQTILNDDPAASEARNAEGTSAVLWAMYTRHPELAQAVLGQRQPDFFEACALGRREPVADLLAARPELINAYAADGFTGLGLAIFFGHLEVARMLVERGADVNLASRNAFRVAPLHSAVAAGSQELVDMLLAHGARPDVAEFVEATPLHSAAGHGARGIVRSLLAAGADRQRRNQDGKTPADVARDHGHAELATELES